MSSATALLGEAMLVNAAGLHARPAVKLTQAAKAFAGTAVEFALAPEGPWHDAKSPVKIMRAKAARGAMLHFRTDGPDAEAALRAMLALVHAGFGEP
jgi:phosphocarrier protein